VHRSDGSGTSFVFTDYLSKVSPEWKSGPGAGTQVNWPAGLGAKGNEGVTGQVKQTPNSVGYIELIYAEQNKLPVASIKNAAGQFVRPSLDSITAAAASVAGQIPDDMRVSLTNAPGATAYPISSFTYLLVYKDQPDQAKGKALVDFLWWAVHDGEQMARDLLYAPLPQEVVQKAEAKINSITWQGKPLRTS
jgi:phosphate transport system substrate-binding protein